MADQHLTIIPTKVIACRRQHSAPQGAPSLCVSTRIPRRGPSSPSCADLETGVGREEVDPATADR